MEKALCKNCKYFRQHYTLDARHVFRVYCGHCTKQKVRCKKPDQAACEHFLSGNEMEEAFVRKEFLSKELLRYMIDLELLPEIKDLIEHEIQ